MAQPIQFRIDQDDILFPFVPYTEVLDALSQALHVGAGPERNLIWVLRFEFPIQGEVVPFFADEDGSLHIALRQNSLTMQQAVIKALKDSPKFQYVQSWLNSDSR
ncbi:hypothetical protein [Nitrospirillum viridazoti]|uniref:Uncharacterized protein n=1 Tax=Nitrospirillum amazonense TaxID=28077 RepID=A0A560IT94_9PROT|nr:hypothetical protein [Nitrospirillum amazonense]TWB62293.1 hypothetical protein FBZ92_105229 [Nitrospirillum amazonense]